MISFFILFLNLPAQATTSLNSETLPVDSCESLSDQFCSDLWNGNTFGNLEKKGVRIYFGKTPHDGIPLFRKMDHEALIQAADSYDPDLKTPLKPLLKKLEKVLIQEKDSTAWYRKLALIRTKINQVIEDVAEARTFKRRPDLKKKKWSQYRIADDIDIQKDLDLVKNHILIKQYENHPHWLRVVKLFPTVKTYLIQALEESNFSKELKETMIERLRQVELSLPIEDPLNMRAMSSCEKSPINAYYFQQANKFTICPGYFNAIQSEGAMFGAMAHELSHSIDPNALRNNEFKKTPIFNLANLLAKNQGQYECTKWSELKSQVLKSKIHFFELPNELKKLTDCFVDHSKLDPINLKTLESPVRAFTKSDMSSLARDQSFSVLASYQIYHKGILEPNDLYLRPDLLEIKANKNSDFNKENGSLYLNHLFSQELKCLVESDKPSNDFKTYFNQLPKNQQNEYFQKALELTEQLYPKYLYEYYAIHGVETRDLLSYNLSKPSVEFWADWLALKAFSRFLKDQKSVEERRTSFLSSSAIFCEPSGLDKLVPEFLILEKNYSLETHPENRTRRLGFFTPEIQNLLNCKMKEANLTDKNRCDL